MTTSNNRDLQQLAARFLDTMQYLSNFVRYEVPDDISEKLNVTHIRALYYVYLQPGINQKDIAERLQLTAATISTSIRYMEDFGLILRQADTQDARTMHLYLGARGQELMKMVRDRQLAVASEFLGLLENDERFILIYLLERALSGYIERSNAEKRNKS
jgi:DNA-binding MarR family transcriptional regulator